MQEDAATPSGCIGQGGNEVSDLEPLKGRFGGKFADRIEAASGIEF